MSLNMLCFAQKIAFYLISAKQNFGADVFILLVII